MTDYVKQINDSIETRLAAVLGSDWSELVYKLEVTENGERNSAKRYGARPLPATSAEGVNQKVTLNHLFEIILMDQYKNKDSDAEQQSVTFTLYDKMDEIIKDLMHTKAGIPSIITLISEPAMDEPEYPLEDVAVLRGSVLIRWRRPT